MRYFTKWNIVAIIVLTLAIVIGVMTFLTTPSSFGEADPAIGVLEETDEELEALDRDRNFRCDNKHWERTIGVGMATYGWMEIDARACYRKLSLANNPGQIIRRKSSMSVHFYNNGYGQTSGINWGHSSPYRTTTASNVWRESLGIHSWWRQCLNVLGQNVCGPTGDFVPYWEYNSPYLTNRCGGDYCKTWYLYLHEGEPGQAAGSYDNNFWWEKR